MTQDYEYDFMFVSLWREPVLVNPLYHFVRKTIDRVSQKLVADRLKELNPKIVLDDSEKSALRYQNKYPCAPALLALASVVDKDYRVQIVSLDVKKEEIGCQDWLEQVVIEICQQTRYGVAISFVTPEVEKLYTFCGRIKETRSDLKVIVGGVHATYYDKDILKNENIDIVIRGEGEETIVELFHAIVYQEDLENLKGISYRKNREIVRNQDRAFIDIKQLPIPAYDLIRDFHDKILLTPTYSRGCPYSCKYCVESAFWTSNVRYKDVGKFCDELEYLNKELDRRFIHIADSTFGVNRKELIELCDELERRKLNCFFSINIRPNIFEYMDEELVIRLKNLNFVEMYMGVETADDDLIESLQRKQNKNQVIVTLEKLKKIGIPFIKLYLMIGSPEETRNSLEKTVKFIEELLEHGLIFYATAKFFVPTPGSPLFDNLKNKVETDWVRYDRYNFPPLYTNQQCFAGELDVYLILMQVVQLKHYMKLIPKEERDRIEDDLVKFADKYYLKEYYC